jgi:hypothetical protein
MHSAFDRARPRGNRPDSLRASALVLLGALAFAPPAVQAAGNCQAPRTGLVPVTELAVSPLLSYAGYAGGLYPDSRNDRPAPHEAAGAFHGSHVTPRDAAGRADAAGLIGILTIGMSNTRNESDAFVKLSAADPLRSPAVRVVNGAEGGASADLIADPAHPYWSRVLMRVAQAGLTPAQVQALWINDAVPNPATPFPGHAQELQGYLAAIVRTAKAMFPNARQCFVSSRIYAGYATTTLNPEPYAYESAFAVKWLVQDQIAGAPELNHDPRRGAVLAPWIAWGPYLWADGTTAREDGLTWVCADFAPDGTHPSPEGSAKVGSLLVDFFRADPVTAPWYRRPAPTGVDVVPAAGAWAIEPARPNPFTDALSVPLSMESAATVQAAVYTADGRRLRTLADGRFAAGSHVLAWDGRDEAGRAVAPGVYFVRVRGAGEARTAKVTRIR